MHCFGTVCLLQAAYHACILGNSVPTSNVSFSLSHLTSHESRHIWRKDASSSGWGGEGKFGTNQQVPTIDGNQYFICQNRSWFPLTSLLTEINISFVSFYFQPVSSSVCCTVRCIALLCSRIDLNCPRAKPIRHSGNSVFVFVFVFALVFLLYLCLVFVLHVALCSQKWFELAPGKTNPTLTGNSIFEYSSNWWEEINLISYLVQTINVDQKLSSKTKMYSTTTCHKYKTKYILW